MKHGVIALLSVCILALSPVSVHAQGFLGGGLPSLPGLPSFGGLFGQGGSCDPSACPGPFNIAGTVAWNYQTIDLDFDTVSAGLLNLGGLKHTYRFNGLQLGLMAQGVSRAGFGARLSFDILVTGSTTDAENYDFLPVGSGGRHWRTKNDTYCFDGMGFYNLYATAAFVGGFRWNHLETTFDTPTGAITIRGLPGDETVLITNIYQPYIGVMLDQGGPSTVMRVGVIGWPQLYGSVEYGETDGGANPTPARINGMTAQVYEGYFWEIFGEYGLREQLYLGASLSVFGKWTQYHLKGTFNADADFQVIGNRDSDYWNISMHRNSWVLGVKLDVPLDLTVPFHF